MRGEISPNRITADLTRPPVSDMSSRAQQRKPITMVRLVHARLCALATIATTLLIACSSGEDTKAKPITMAFIPKTSNNLVFRLGNEGAQYAASNLTAASGREVKVEYLASEELSFDAERAQVEDAIAAKVDGILISCVDDQLTTVIDEAANAGIPVITYDSDCPNSKRLAFYSMQSEDAGAKSADLLVASLGSGAKTVAILTGYAGSDNLERRVSGFATQLAAKYPDVQIVTTVNCAETAESCGAAIEDQILSTYPDLDGLLVTGLWGTQAGCTCDSTGLQCTCEDTQLPKWKAAAKAKLKTVSYDALPFALVLMKQGYLSGLIGQKYFGWGYDTVTVMFDHLVNGRQLDGFLDSKFDVVCPNNVDNMAKEWQTLDFRKALVPACDLVP
jgi:ribose transport system substrate-binding protein